MWGQGQEARVLSAAVVCGTGKEKSLCQLGDREELRAGVGGGGIWRNFTLTPVQLENKPPSLVEVSRPIPLALPAP